MQMRKRSDPPTPNVSGWTSNSAYLQTCRHTDDEHVQRAVDRRRTMRRRKKRKKKNRKRIRRKERRAVVIECCPIPFPLSELQQKRRTNIA